MTIETQEIALFKLSDSAIERLKEEYSSLKINGIEDKAGYKAVKAARMDIKRYRVDVDKRRKELTADALKHQRLINSEAKRITELLQPIEDYLLIQEKNIDAELEKIKIEKDNQELMKISSRINSLMKLDMRLEGIFYICDYYDHRISSFDIKNLSDKDFEDILFQLSGYHFSYTKKLAEEKKRFEEMELAAKKDKEEQENKLREELEKSKLESDKLLRKHQETMKLEQEELAKIKIELELLQKMQRQELEMEQKLLNEQKIILAQQEEKIRAEFKEKVSNQVSEEEVKNEETNAFKISYESADFNLYPVESYGRCETELVVPIFENIAILRDILIDLTLPEKNEDDLLQQANEEGLENNHHDYQLILLGMKIQKAKIALTIRQRINTIERE